MPRPFSEERQQEWKNKILAQRESKLPISVWCRQNSIPAYIFSYWQRKLFPKEPLDRSAFTEIIDAKDSSGITLECQGITIHLDPHFDTTVLRKCLEVLKKC